MWSINHTSGERPCSMTLPIRQSRFNFKAAKLLLTQSHQDFQLHSTSRGYVFTKLLSYFHLYLLYFLSLQNGVKFCKIFPMGTGSYWPVTWSISNPLNHKIVVKCFRIYNQMFWSQYCATLFQDGSLHHNSDSLPSLIGNIGCTTQFGIVNQESSKWKHNKSELDMYGRGTVLPFPCDPLLQTPTMY